MLTVTISDKSGQESRLEFPNTPITIGRMKENDIVLPEGNVSKRHSRIFAKEGNFVIVDQGSTNGTFINGRRIPEFQEIVVAATDKIYIGGFIMQLEGEARLGAGLAPPPTPGGPAGRPMQDTVFEPGDDAPNGQAHDIRSTGFDPPPGHEPVNPMTPPGFGPHNSPTGPQSSPQTNAPPLIPNDAVAAIPEADIEPIDVEPLGDNEFAPEPTPAGNDGFDVANVPLADAAPTHGVSDVSQMASADPIFLPPGGDDVVDALPALGQSAAPAQSALRGLGTQGSATIIAAVPEPKSERDEDFITAQQAAWSTLEGQLELTSLSLQRHSDDDHRDRVETAVAGTQAGAAASELVDLMCSELRDLGPLAGWLEDDSVSAVHVNRFDHILVERSEGLEDVRHVFSSPHTLELAIFRLLQLDAATARGLVHGRLDDGSQLRAVLAPLALDGPALTVRKPRREHPGLDELVERGALSAAMAEFLRCAVEAGRSILVAGPTDSGKSTLIGALASLLPQHARIVTVEAMAQLNLPQPGVMRLEARPEQGFDLRDALRSAMALRPQRIVLDGCQGPEAFAWVSAAASGTDGSMLSTHGISARDALGRVESLCLLDKADISPRGLREQVARAIDLIVVCNRRHDGSFHIEHVTELQGVDLDAYRLSDIFYHRVDGAAASFHPTGYVPMFYEDMRHAGLDVDFDIFRE